MALEDGTILLDVDLPEDSLVPLADSIEKTVAPPYRSAAMRTEGDVWTGVAETIRIVELPAVEADEIDLTVVGGRRELTLDGETTSRPLAGLDAIAGEHGDVAVHAERVDGRTFAVDVFPL